MTLKNILLATITILLLAPVTANACTQTSVDAVVNVYVEVGMWGAAFNGGYVDAAYEALGEELDSRSNLNTATSVFVVFTYSASFLGIQGTSLVNLCLEREEGQTWEDITTGLVEEISIQLAEMLNAGHSDEGFGGQEYMGDSLSSTSLTFPPNAVIVVGGWASRLGGPRRGRVTCQPACF